MVLLRKQERKNYDIDKCPKPYLQGRWKQTKNVYAKERKGRNVKRKNAGKKEISILEEINKFSNPDNVDGVF